MLTDRRIRLLKSRESLYRLADGAGLCIEVATSGSRLWRFRYRHNGVARMVSLGTYPDVSLQRARELCADQRRLVAGGLDPSLARKQERARGDAAAGNTFNVVADAYLKRQVGRAGKAIADVTVAKREWLIGLAKPLIGSRPINEIAPTEVLAVLRRVESTGKLETASRLRVLLSMIWRHAIVHGLAERNPAAELQGALAAPKVKHRAAITDPKRLGGLLRALDAYDGHAITTAALRLAPYVFVRPGELRGAQWDEIDLDAGEWRIPAARMKMGEEHVVPLASQAVAILKELHPLTKSSTYVFPSLRSFQRCMSENAVNAALRRLGYAKEEVTGHGFRATASTRLNELGWAPDIIERQLAHAERNKVRSAYNRAAYLDERRKMMVAWADYLDGLRAGADVIAIRKSA